MGYASGLSVLSCAHESAFTEAEPQQIDIAELASNFENAKSFTEIIGFPETRTSPLQIQAMDEQAKARWQSISSSAVAPNAPLAKYRQQFAKADICALRKACKAFGLPMDKHRTILIDSLIQHLNNKNNVNTSTSSTD